MAELLDGDELPAPGHAPRRGSTITLSGRLARVYGYAQPGRPGAVHRAPSSRRRRCSTWRSRPAATPTRRASARRSRRSARRSAAADELLGSRGRHAPGDRPGLPRDRARRHRACPSRALMRSRRAPQACSHTAAHSPRCDAARARACRGARRTRRRPRRPRPRAAPRRSAARGAAASARGELEQQAAQQVARPRPAPARPSARVRRRRSVARAGRSGAPRCSTPLTAAFSLRRLRRSRARCRGRAPARSRAWRRRSPAPPSRVPTSSSGPGRGSRAASSSSSSRHRRVVACAPVPNAWPGSITISCDLAARGLRRLPRRAHVQRRHRRRLPARPADAAARSGPGGGSCFQRSLQSSAISLV